MEDVQAQGIIHHFSDIEDPRSARGKRHLLIDIICIAILAVICDANDYEEIEAYGLSKEAWLNSFLALPHGIPSYDTFRRVFSVLNAEAWQSCFVNWVRSLDLPISETEDVLAIDGKTARRSRDGDLGGLHTVSVWSSQQGIVIGQQQTTSHSNEITVLPELIESLDIAGAVVSIDAMGTQKQVAWAIKEHDGDYMLALKSNHPKLYQDVTWLFEDAASHDWLGISHDYYETTDKAHGREEHRRVWVLDDLSILDDDTLRAWRGLQSVACVASTRRIKGRISTEKRYYLSSLPLDAKRAAHAIRSHWSVENNLHWVLDMSFREDESRVRKGHGQANWVTLRHIALNLLKLDTSIKASIKVKRKRAGWDNDYLLQLLK